MSKNNKINKKNEIEILIKILLIPLMIMSLSAYNSSSLNVTELSMLNTNFSGSNQTLSNISQGNFVQSISCGNKLCEIAENRYNCPQDCAIERVNAKLLADNIWLTKNQETNLTLEIVNNQNSSLIININISDNLKQKINLPNSIILKPLEKKYLDIFVVNQEKVEKTNISEYYSGDITLSFGNNKLILPLLITISDSENEVLKLISKPLTNTIYIENALPIYILILKKDASHEDITINYFIYDSDNKEIFSKQDKISFNNRYEQINYINLKDKFNEGQYTLLTQITYQNKDYLYKSSFYVNAPFWTETRLNILIFSLIGLIIIGVIAYGVIRYLKYRHERVRYLGASVGLLPKKSSDSFEIGFLAGEEKVKAFYNPWDLTTHALVSGSTGSGKSVSASILVEEALLHNVSVVVFDPTAQWTGFLKPCTDPNLLKFYSSFGLKENDARGFKGLIYNVNSPDIELNFKEYMVPGEVTVFNLSSLGPGEYDVAVSKIISEMFKIKWEETPDLRLLVVFDEVHRLLEKYGGKGGYVALEKACREFRKWGIGLVMASQVSTDFKDAIQGNILTEIQLNTKNLDDIKKIGEKYGVDYSKRVTRQGIGVGLLQNPKYNDGKPWFVQFRPTLHSPHKLLESDLKLYTEYSEKLKQLEKLVLCVKDKGVSDIDLELKLAKAKLKEGHFKMTQMYINNIESSIKNDK